MLVNSIKILSISIILAKMKISYEFTPTFWGAKSLGLPVANVLWILQKLLKSCSLPLFSHLMQKYANCTTKVRSLSIFVQFCSVIKSS